MKRTKIAAIDVGTSKVCTIMADVSSTGELRILGFGVALADGLEKGMGFNDRNAAASISQSVKRAVKMAGYGLKSAYIGISGAGMSSLNSRGIVSIPHNDETVHPSDRKRALEIAQSVEVPHDQKLLHLIPKSFTLDGQGNIRDPIGMHGFRLQVDSHVITMPLIKAQNISKCITSLGISIDGLVLKSLASAEAVLTEDEKQNGVMLADIGSGTTNIALFKNGSVYHTSILPVGGHTITNDIAVGLGIPFDVAEKMKKSYGNVMPKEEKSFSDVTVTEDGHAVPYCDLREVIVARVEELIRLVLCQLPESDYQAIPSGLVLTGGSCHLPGITELGHEITRLKVRIGTPLNLNQSDDVLRAPDYACSVGLLYWTLKNREPKDWQTNKWNPGVLLPSWLGTGSAVKSALKIGLRR